jgi:hypothetical protein
MSKRNRLLLQHLEDISWRILDDYPEVIRDMIRGRSGIYALYRRGKLYYVGLARNLMARLSQHLKDRHGGSWDRFSVYLTKQDDHMKELEALLLRIVNPAGNRQGGRFAASENLLSHLNRCMKERDADRRAELIGGWIAKRHRRIKAARGKGSEALAGAVERRTQLRGYRKGWEYFAILRKDGKVRYDGRTFDSPSAAAKAALGRSANGWSFWRYRNDKGQWVPLKELRK